MTESNIVVSSKPHTSTRSKRFVYGATAVCAVVFFGAVYAWQVAKQPTAPAPKKEASAPTSVRAVAPPPADYYKSQSELDKALAQAKTPQAKASIYVQKIDSGRAHNEAFEKLVTYCQSAEQISPSRESAIGCATLYEYHGDRAQAAQYYQLFIDRMDAAYRDAHKVEYEQYQRHLQQLRGDAS
jgi:hypothetical protein